MSGELTRDWPHGWEIVRDGDRAFPARVLASDMPGDYPWFACSLNDCDLTVHRFNYLGRSKYGHTLRNAPAPGEAG